MFAVEVQRSFTYIAGEFKMSLLFVKVANLCSIDRTNKKLLQTLVSLWQKCNDSSTRMASHDTSQQGRITDYNYFFNTKARRRMPSILRELLKKPLPPQGITFGVGVPNVQTFPFQEISVKLKNGSSYKIDGKDLEIALQYLPSLGYPPLLKQLQDLQDKIHGPQDWTKQSLMVTSGSSEAMAAVFDMILTHGDPIIIAIPLYSGVAEMLRPYNPQYIGLEQDKDGVQPHQLRRLLEERVQEDKPLPKLMYINPTACNPTGRNLSLQRRKELYKIASEYNFLILEDDPYYFLSLMEVSPASLLSMDVEGRVIRAESFSKILSSGLRVGFVTGPSHLIRQIELHIQVSTLHTAGVPQVIVSKLLKSWDHEGYLQHIEQVKKFYRERRDLMVAACNRYLKDVAEWNVPTGGMFLWVKVPVLKDTWSLAIKHCMEKHLIVVPGHPFTAGLTPPQYNYIRLSFSLASPEQMDKGVKLLAEIIQEAVKNGN
ncbi:kynurenine/alpha-aminoadipate aminotransferase, mitochondrial-like [Homalodisca vitripennis]|uniref:kynurenine/alpha-aminoadipate aminotransferase, mitochondrial-like n=1 Tax=Homalodisca vitripennis TaxID=197043 RepID=UPI001EEA34F7|nr:kynurenine/alpha-aminoadipate aminotransferase, mitochondrial-like [Homalodisca vitripennis]